MAELHQPPAIPSASTPLHEPPARRRPRRLAVALAAASVLVAAVLAGCGGGGSSATTSAGGVGSGSSSDGQPVADTTESGGAPSGTLGWSTAGPTSWDPVTSSAGNDVSDLSLVYASLTRLSPDGDAEPALATKWEFSKDGLSFTLFLRKGQKFTDGTPFNAEAVKTNLERGEHESDSLIIPYLEAIKSIKVDNPYQLTLSLSTKDYVLPLVLGGKVGMMVSPKAIKDDPKGLATKPVGAGPFELTNYVAPTSATLVRNPGYWDAKDIHLEGVDLKFFTDEQALLSSLLSGQVQLANIGGEQVQTAESAGFQVEEFPSLHVASIEVNDKMAPFDNHKFVEAVNYAIDRETLLQTLAGGHGEVDVEAFPPGYSAYNKSVADYYTYDPEKAQELLKQANYDGTPITITWTEFPGLNIQSESEQLQSQLEAVGIKSTLKSVPSAQLTELVYVKHSVQFNPNGIVGREAPSQMLETQYAADGLLNPGRDASPELTKALDAVATFEVGTPQYESALQEATKLATEQSANIMLFTQPFLLAHTTSLTGLKPWIETPRLEGVRLSE
ncbi:MAG: ABC transporter substrate-binding protein [Solirubrobacterales bacterium]